MLTNNKKVYVIAGEASGDFIGGALIAELKKKIQSLDIRCIGGRKMEEQGYASLFDIKKISLMGYLEIIPHIFTLKRLIYLTVRHVLHENPDVLITIDSPGFNLRVVADLKKRGFKGKLVHVVAPSVWAHHPEVAAKVANLYDHLLTLLPFEPPYFIKHGLKTDYIGHPIFEQNFIRSTQLFRDKHNIPKDSRIICVTPGSRKGEIKQHMKIFIQALDLLKTKYNIFPVFALSKKEDASLVESYISNKYPHVSVFGDERLDAYSTADFALAKSGTNTLEISACGTPMVVAYKMNSITYWYIMRKILIKYACLINILLKKEIIPELIQDNCTPIAIASTISKYLSNDVLSETQVLEAREALHMIGYESNIKASTRAADIIINRFLR
jgi:lipid-A-disaccharide synthase